jgi:hypothetical protein
MQPTIGPDGPTAQDEPEAKTFREFRDAFATDALTPESMRTLKYAMQEYLKTIEKDITKHTTTMSQAGEVYHAPEDRNTVEHEDLVFLYGIAQSCSSLLFYLSYLSGAHGIDI